MCVRERGVQIGKLEVECGNFKLGNVSQDSWVMFGSPCLKDPGKGPSAEPSIMWGLCAPEDKASLITVNDESQENTASPQASPGDPVRDLGVPSPFLPQHLGMERPCLPQAFTPLRPPLECATLSCTLLLTRTLALKLRGELGAGLDWGVEETGEHYLFKGKEPLTLPTSQTGFS